MCLGAIKDEQDVDQQGERRDSIVRHLDSKRGKNVGDILPSYLEMRM